MQLKMRAEGARRSCGRTFSARIINERRSRGFTSGYPRCAPSARKRQV